MELKDLVGQHELSGVDMVELAGSYGPASVCRFVLDGKIYTVTEDESDGYRSSMQDIVEGGEPVVNLFEPQKVLCSMDEPGTDRDEILSIRDVVTGKIVLSVGTSATDDYYPSFIANFQPENMACNASNPQGNAK